jgi:hypothetical protein
VPFNPQENEEQFQRQKPHSARPTSKPISGTNPNQFKPDLEPDFSVPFNPHEHEEQYREVWVIQEGHEIRVGERTYREIRVFQVGH